MSPSNSSMGRPLYAPLPLIRCPFCSNGNVEWWVSKTNENPGRHFYKCEHEWFGTCNFWVWEDAYLPYIKARWPKLFLLAKSGNKKTTTSMQADLKLLLCLALANLAALVYMMQKSN